MVIGDCVSAEEREAGQVCAEVKARTSGMTSSTSIYDSHVQPALH